MRSFALCLLTLTLALPALASDGVLEISQTCATQTGCFPGDTAGFPVTISASGSYRLTSDLTVPDENTTGITFSDGTVSAVSIDLGGFEIRGPVTCSDSPLTCTPDSGTGSGVARVSAENRGISVKNGSITGMGLAGVLLGDQAEVTDLRVRWNRGEGISASSDSTVAGSSAYENGGRGIVTGESSVVSGSTASGNGSDGMSVGSNSTVSTNTVSRNEGSGIDAASGATVSGNTVSSNGSSGIVCGECTVRENTVRSNSGIGIQVAGGSLVQENSVLNSGGSGIRVTNDASRIEGNNVASSGGHGIEVASADNLIIRNSAKHSTGGHYSIVAGNRVGIIVVPTASALITNNGPGAGLGTSDPWANFAY